MLEVELGREQVADNVTLQAGRDAHGSRARTRSVGRNDYTAKTVHSRLVPTVRTDVCNRQVSGIDVGICHGQACAIGVCYGHVSAIQVSDIGRCLL